MNTDPLKPHELATIAMAGAAAMAGKRIGIVCNEHSDTPAKFRERIKQDWPQVRVHMDKAGPHAGGHTLVLVKIETADN